MTALVSPHGLHPSLATPPGNRSARRHLPETDEAPVLPRPDAQTRREPCPCSLEARRGAPGIVPAYCNASYTLPTMSLPGFSVLPPGVHFAGQASDGCAARYTLASVFLSSSSAFRPTL